MKQKNNFCLIFIGFLFIANAHGASTTQQSLTGGDATGQTFFYARPQFQDAMPEKISLFRNDRALARDCGWGGAFQVVPLGGQTTNKNTKRLARYFMFEEKDQLFVANATVPNIDSNQGINRDLNPTNFNVVSLIGGTLAPYQSTLSFRPKQSVVGAGFNYIQYFGWNNQCERKWWAEISFPLLRISNDMRLTETNIITTPGATLIRGSAPTLTAALTGQFGFVNGVFMPINLGKIDGKQQKTGIADVEIKIGYEYVRNDCAYLYSYIGVLAPSGNKPTAEFVFEPIVGENHHVGFLSGGSGGYEIWTGCNKSLWFNADVAWRYLFSNSQLRSFDLYNRPWSRYMPVFLNLQAAAAGNLTSGISIFTQKMKVHPGVQFDINAAFSYTSACGLQAEAGYNIWARTAEKVRLSTPWQVSAAIANVPGTTPPVANIINRISNINEDFNGVAVDLTATPVQPNTLYLIQPGDINLNSAAAPGAFTQTIYGTLGYNLNWCLPTIFTIGGSYEWSRNNTALTRWLVWGKIGVSL